MGTVSPLHRLDSLLRVLRVDDAEMRIPNCDNAEIAPSKLQDYLLNLTHRRGATKARLLHSFGYCAEEWRRLEADIRMSHLTSDIDAQRDTDYGRRFEVVAPLATPSGRSLLLRSIWQIDAGSQTPRLITIIPE